MTQQPILFRGEAESRTRRRREDYLRRMAQARNTKDQLSVTADYFRAVFAHCSPAQVRRACDALVQTTDIERGRNHDSE